MRLGSITLISLAAGLSAWFSWIQPEASAEQERDDDALAPIYGAYEYVGGQRQIEEMNRRIEAGVEELSVFIRGIAERRLQEANHPTDKLTLSLAKGEIAVARSGKPEMVAPANGAFVDWKNPENGNELRVSHELKGGVLWQRLEGDRGSSINRFVLGKDGRRLLVKTEVRVDRLDEPIRLDATYRRVSR